MDCGHLSFVVSRSRRRLAGRRSRPAGSGEGRVGATFAAERQGDADAGGVMAAMACGGRPRLVELLSHCGCAVGRSARHGTPSKKREADDAPYCTTKNPRVCWWKSSKNS